MRIFFALPFLFYTICNAQMPAASGSWYNRPGGVDTSPPILFLSSTAPNPLIGGTFIDCTAYIGSKPVTGFTSADFTRVNCTVSNFVNVDAFTYTFRVSPTVAGTFSVFVPAGSCVDLRGTPNIDSNLLEYEYINDNSLDLENTVITLSQHYRGHTASFSDCNDYLSNLSVPGMELIWSKYNFGATMYSTGDNQILRDMYNFGRCDLGTISFSNANFLEAQPLVTAARGGVPPSVQSYKNGDITYKTDQIPLVLYGRSSFVENINQTLPVTYGTGLTDVMMVARGVTIRYDPYSKNTSNSYALGSLATGDGKITTYVNNVLSINGWYSHFVHWHWQLYDYPEHYMNLMTSLIGSNDVYRGGSNVIAEYYWAREAVTSVSGTGITLTVNYAKDYPSSPYNLIATPIYVKINTTGSNYEGADIVCSNGLKIRKVSANEFYVPVLLDFTQTTATVDIVTTTEPSYVNLDVPVINRTGNSVTVDQPCKLTIFRVHKPTSFTTSVTSNAIPTVDNTTVNFTVATGLTLAAKTALRITNDGTHYFYASVISYTSGTGALSVSCSSVVGTGTFSSWTIDKYFHPVTAEVVERKLTPVTSYTILATLDNTNYTYYVAAINSDGVSAVIP